MRVRCSQIGQHRGGAQVGSRRRIGNENGIGLGQLLAHRTRSQAQLYYDRGRISADGGQSHDFALAWGQSRYRVVDSRAAQIVATTPAGTAGAVTVAVTTSGGTATSPAAFTYTSSTPPDPPPAFPPGAPTQVITESGDGRVTVSWAAPASTGSFPISTYQAVVSPGGQSCLVSVPALTCTMTGLTNGTAYTVAVRALSGAGWGALSPSSNPFTPAPVDTSILITGTRGDIRGRPGVIVTGTSTGLAGQQVAPWVKFPGQTSYTQGVVRPTVTAEGDFTWQRRTGKKIYVYFRGVDTDVRSQRIIMPKH